MSRKDIGGSVLLPRSGEDFASTAARLSGIAGALFGWTPDIFWNATPAELAALATALRGDAAPALGGGELARLMEALPDG